MTFMPQKVTTEPKTPILMRRIEVWRNNEWVEVRMSELEIGDIFRMFEPLDFVTQVIDESGDKTWKVTGIPFMLDTNPSIPGVKCEPCKEPCSPAII